MIRNHPFKGKHHTKETKEKISFATMGRKNVNYGKKLSKEHKDKISKAIKLMDHSYKRGRIFSKETREKISAGNRNRNRKITKEQKKENV